MERASIKVLGLKFRVNWSSVAAVMKCAIMKRVLKRENGGAYKLWSGQV